MTHPHGKRATAPVLRVLTGFVVLIAMALVTAPAAYAGWRAVGGTLNAQTRDSLEVSQDLATVAGVPWIAWTERTSPDDNLYIVRVARWDGSAWIAVGTSPNVDPTHGAAAPSIADIGGVAHVAWTERDGGVGVSSIPHVRVAKWTGSAWLPLGGTLDTPSSSNLAAKPELAAIGATPYVAYFERGVDGGTPGAYVKRWTGTAWVPVGDPVGSGGTHTFAVVGGVPYVGYADAFQQSQLHVARWTGTEWLELGTRVDHAGTEHGGAPVLADVAGRLTAAWTERTAAGLDLRVAQWNGTAWVDLPRAASEGPGAAATTPALVDLGGRPTVAWGPGDGGTGPLRLRSWTGSQWLQLGAGLQRQPDSTPAGPSVATVAGRPFVSWLERFTETVGSGEGASFVERFRLHASTLEADGDTSRFRFTTATAQTSEANGEFVATVQRTGDPSVEASVNFRFLEGTARPGSDYVGQTGTLTFGSGETEKSITVTIVGDETPEPTEALSIVLYDPLGDAELGTPSTLDLTIVDDDAIDTTITSGPQGYLADLRFRFFLFAANPAIGATFLCTLDGTQTPCTSPFDPGALSEGPHTFSVSAVNADGVADKTPATRSFTVDTVRPVTTLTAYGNPLPTGAWSGPVQVRALSIDPEPASGVTEIRCAVDSAEVPLTASDLRDPCPVTVREPGTHVIYAAAVDAAGNAGVITSVRVRIAVPPETEITEGTSGSTTSIQTRFVFRAVPSGTLECSLDGAPWAACASPVVRDVTTKGTHVFRVRTISPDGEADPTPASRTFTLEDRVVTGNCEGLVPWGVGIVFAPGSYTITDVGLGGVKCKAITEPCPAGSKCSVTTRVWATDQDEVGRDDDHKESTRSPWTASAESHLSPVVSTGSYDRELEYCRPVHDRSARDLEKPCPATASATAIGPQTATGTCVVERSFFGAGFHVKGDDQARRFTCNATLTISPASPLAVIGIGSKSAAVYAPKPGKVSVSASAKDGGASAARRAGVAARFAAPKKKRKRAIPAISTVTRTVAGPGYVELPLKFSKATATTLKRKGKLTIPVVVTFTPAGEKPVMSRQNLVIELPTVPAKVKKIKQNRANAFPRP